MCPSRLSLFSWPQVGQNLSRCFIYGTLPRTNSPSRLSLSKQLTCGAVGMYHLRQSDEPLPDGTLCTHTQGTHTVMRKMRGETSPRGITYILWVTDFRRPGFDLVLGWSVLCCASSWTDIMWQKSDNLCINYNSLQVVQLLSSGISVWRTELLQSLALSLRFEKCLSVSERGFVLCVLLGCQMSCANAAWSVPAFGWMTCPRLALSLVAVCMLRGLKDGCVEAG